MKKFFMVSLFLIMIFQICWGNLSNLQKNDELDVSIIGSQKRASRDIITPTYTSPNVITNTFTGSQTIFVNAGIGPITYLSEVALYDGLTPLVAASSTNLTTPQSFTATFSNLNIPSEHLGNLTFSAWVQIENQIWEQLQSDFMVTETVPTIVAVTPTNIPPGVPTPIEIDTEGIVTHTLIITDTAPFGMGNSETNVIITSTDYLPCDDGDYIVTMTIPLENASNNWFLYMLFNQDEFDYNINHDMLVIDTSQPEMGDLFISEVCDDREMKSEGDGFIEIYNASDQLIDLNNVEILRGNIDGGIFNADGTSFSLSGSIEAQGFYVISNGSDLSTFNSYWSKSLTSGQFIASSGNLDITNGYAYALDDGSKVILDESPEVPIDERATQTEPGIWIEGGLPADGEPGTFGDDEGPLPVTLSGFNAYQQSDYAMIEWRTLSETDMHHFEVYRAVTDNYSTSTRLDAITAVGPNHYTYQDNAVEIGQTYFYWLKAVENDGTSQNFGSIEITLEQETAPDISEITELQSNYPNPFNPSTRIQYQIQAGHSGILTIFNAKGQTIEIIELSETTGLETYTWDGTKYGSGIYFYELRTDNYVEVKKMIMLK